MKFRLGELFSGPGGLALAAKDAAISVSPEFRITHQWAVDNHLDSCETYRKNICPGSESVICESVTDVDLTALQPIDAFAFGFPCNDFSVVGEKLGFDGVYGPLYTYGVGVLRHHRPKWFLAENVSGLRSSGGGRELDKILADLENEGYRLTPHLYSFDKYGVPQARRRIIIVGIRADLDLDFRVPAPLSAPVSARSAIECPPIGGDAANHELTRQSKTVVERLLHIQPGQNAWTATLPEHLKLNVKRTRLSHIYKRLDPDKPAYTVTGSGGGGTHMYHWSEPRALTNRERARLQTFPDSFHFLGTKESVRRQIGMAVPPRGAQVIFEAILKTFAHQAYDAIEPNIPFASDPQLQLSVAE